MVLGGASKGATKDLRTTCSRAGGRRAYLGMGLEIGPWGFLKFGVSLWDLPRIRTIAFWGLYWGPPILGNYHLEFCNLGFQLALHRECSRDCTEILSGSSFWEPIGVRVSIRGLVGVWGCLVCLFVLHVGLVFGVELGPLGSGR